MAWGGSYYRFIKFNGKRYLKMIPDEDQNSEYWRERIPINSVESGEPWYNMCISKDGQLSVIDTRLNIKIKFIFQKKLNGK